MTLAPAAARMPAGTHSPRLAQEPSVGSPSRRSEGPRRQRLRPRHRPWASIPAPEAAREPMQELLAAPSAELLRGHDPFGTAEVAEPQPWVQALGHGPPRPVAEPGADGKGEQIVIRPMMYVALTYDHRLIDGSEAVRFLVKVKELIEDPGALLVD